MIYSGIEDMDIKSGGREMATVVYSNEEDGMCSFVIDNKFLYKITRFISKYMIEYEINCKILIYGGI